MIPADLVPLFASMIILSESVCGTALIFDLRRKEVTTILLLMMLIFSTAVVKELWFGGESSCGCFGKFSVGNVDGWTLVRNGVLMLLIFRLNGWNNRRKISNANLSDD
jgi:hypothetical protein